MPPARLPPHDCAWRRSRLALGIALAVVAVAGCTSANSARQVSYLPVGAAPTVAGGGHAAVVLTQAQELDRSAQHTAVDAYYQATALAAQEMDLHAASGAVTGQSDVVYRQALHGFIDSAQRYGRLDACRQSIVVAGGGRVPVRFLGFAWRPQDFSSLAPAAGQESRHIFNHYRTPGLGVPLIGERIACCQQERFFRPKQPFAVTAVLRPVSAATGGGASAGHVLDLYNPMVFQQASWNGTSRPLARDLTAPLAAAVNEAPPLFLRGFTAPTDVSVQPQLVMSEPYQRGKIPVIFIHGLASDPTTWANMANDLRAQRDLYDLYQFWTFRYPTGGELLDSAAALRDNLQLVRATYDPQHTDQAMDAMVLVGHSLGGLVSKMQVTWTCDVLWREVAVQPFAAVRAPPQVLVRLQRGLFFEPVPMVTRVVFIGTPHQGSVLSRRLVGIVSSALVNFGSAEEEAYQNLMDDNPDVFKPQVRRGRPTTINMLAPESPILAGLARLPVNPATRLHSIIGTGGINPFREPGDGVVAVSSAQHYGDSALFVPAKHEQLHRDPRSIAEVARILRVHATTFVPAAPPTTATMTPRQQSHANQPYRWTSR